MLIECDTCTMRDIACDDCVVAVLLSSAPASDGARGRAASHGDAERVDERAVVGLTDDERVALAVLAGDGLVPPLRLVQSPPA